MKKILLITLSLLLLSGCLVGPRYRPPNEPMPLAFNENREVEPDPNVDEDLAHWWTFFNDPFLDELLRESLAGSFDLRIAVEKVCQARAAFYVSVAGIFPEFDFSGVASRSRTSKNLTTTSRSAPSALQINVPPIQSFYEISIDAVWQIDLFGALRRTARAAYFTWQSTAEDARNARIILLSEVATTYTNIRTFQQLIEVAKQVVELDEGIVALANDRFHSGIGDEQDRDTAIATLDTDRANLLVYETSLKQAIYSLGILLGYPPENLVNRFATSGPIPVAIGRIPVGLPSDLLRRRPDIRSAERKIAAATEEIGVAVANLFPQVSLTGSSTSFSANPLQGANVSYASNTIAKLLQAPSLFWGIGGFLSYPLFDFGKRMETIKEEASLRNQAFLTYEETVVSALQEVESDLVAYFNEELRLAALTEGTEASKRAFDLTYDLYQAGLDDYTQVLIAKNVWLTALYNLIGSQQALSNDLISLYKALGGGWECSYTP